MSMRDDFANFIHTTRAFAAQRLSKVTPRQKRRWRRGTIVAAIAALGVFSMDHVLTGGPDWNPIGADAEPFTLVASAEAAEHAAVLPRSNVNEPAPQLPDLALPDVTLALYDPGVSADDLLGAPVYGDEINTDIELVDLIQSLRTPAQPLLELKLEPIASWR